MHLAGLAECEKSGSINLESEKTVSRLFTLFAHNPARLNIHIFRRSHGTNSLLPCSVLQCSKEPGCSIIG